MNGWVVLYLVLEFLCLAAGIVFSARTPSMPAHYSATQRLTAPSFQVKTGQYVEWNFEVPQTCRDSRVAGDFHATTGPIEVFITDEAGFANWKRQRNFAIVYQSGRVAQGSVDINLPSEPRMYYLVFRSPPSTSAEQEVRTDIKLSYTCEVSRSPAARTMP